MSGCRQKGRFRSELNAKLALTGAQSRNDDNRLAKAPHRVYRCERCPGWHFKPGPYPNLTGRGPE